MIEITLQPIKAQRLEVVLGGQLCSIRLYQHETGLFCDLTVGGIDILNGVKCLNQNRIVRYPYLGFKGDLFFMDTQGRDDPMYDGLGTRFKFFYLGEDELSK